MWVYFLFACWPKIYRYCFGSGYFCVQIIIVIELSCENVDMTLGDNVSCVCMC